MKTVILSDLHINGNFRAVFFIAMMKLLVACGYRRFIINGDAIEHANTAMDPEHLQAIAHLAKMKDDGITIMRVRGNHDLSGHDMLNEALKIPSLKEFWWSTENGRTFLARHGHQFDRFISRNMLLSKVMSVIFLFLQKWDLRSRWFTRMLDRLHGMWFGLADMVQKGAIRYAHRKKIDVIVCGHTHQPAHTVDLKGKHLTEYWNSGDWSGDECSFLTVDEEGVVELYVVRNCDGILV